VLFGPHSNPPEDETVNVTNPNSLRSLWFDASSGIFYTLTGDPLTLGSGLAADERMVTVISDWSGQAENNLEMDVTFVNERRARIENYSEGGLRFGGTVTLGEDLIISGSGATHFAGQLEGRANFSLEYAGATPAHLVLSGENKGWDGKLTVGSQTLAFLKADMSLGWYSEAHSVLSGGTLSWRSHVAQPLAYENPMGTLIVEGKGAIRQPGTDPVGAIYNDGGENSYRGDIEMRADTWFGARGDLLGSLTLTGRITVTEKARTFTKVGPGLIILTNEDNYWRTTHINDGVLAVTAFRALGGQSNLVFGGGILGFLPEAGDFAANLGTGSGQVSWAGSGGFTAFGQPRTVTLNGGAALTWGQQHFVQDGYALLLGSRYNTASAITFANSLDLGSGSHREIRVEGLGVISGLVSGTSTGTGLRKTGSGILYLANTNNDYSGPTIIEDGALLGALSPNSNLQLGGGFSGTGGVFMISSGFSQSLGSAAGQVQWLGHGGFASVGTNTVQLGGTADPLAWGAPYFVADGQELRFGHYLLGGTILWDRPLDLGGGNRTIRLQAPSPNAAVLLMNQPLSGGWGGLNIVGSGTMDIIKANPSFGGVGNVPVNLFGTTLRLYLQGSFSDMPIDFTLRYGGKLWLRNTTTAHNDNRIHDLSNLTLEGGELRYQENQGLSAPIVETFGALKLPGFAANKIVLDTNRTGEAGEDDIGELAFTSLVRDATLGRSTLDVSGLYQIFHPVNGGWFWPGETTHDPTLPPRDESSLTGTSVVITQAINDQLVGLHTEISDYYWSRYQFAIFPWATADEGKYWLTSLYNYDTEHYLWKLPTYHTADQSTWAGNSWDNLYNISTDGSSGILTGDRYINSLRLTGGTLNLGGHTLTINSGGLLDAKPDQGGNSVSIITGVSGSQITTAMPVYQDESSNIIGYKTRPLYMHIYSDRLQIAGGVSISTLGADVVKTGPGELWLNSSANHQIGSLYINQGTVDLRRGTLTLSGADARIYIGDGAGTDILKLAPNHRNQIQKQGGGLPSITLQGTPYAPRGPEYGGTQAILQTGGNTKLQLKNLHIEGRGTIDWVGGEVGRANMIWLDTLTFSGPDAILFMRNWYEYEDYLLVRTNGFDLNFLQNIRFEGYENFPVVWRKYDQYYHQITPFGLMSKETPEPATYGALLGAVGLGLVAWRKRRRQRPSLSSTARGAVACRHSHLNRDLARTLRVQTQIAILK